jgi:hypothetical protein
LRRIVTLLVLLSAMVLAASAQTTTAACSAVSLGDLGALNGWVPSPNDAWHQDISAKPVDANSDKIMTTSGDLANRYLHPDFSNVVDGGYGIPYTVVDSTKVPLVTIAPWDTEDSDNTLYPLPTNVPIEGNPGQCWTDSADHHAIVIDRTTCADYEIYQADLCSGQWSSYGNVIWDLTVPNGEKRPYGMSSVDAAGLSIFEGLVRYDEIVAGGINHAIRFTATHTKNDNANGYFTAPAVHAAGNLWGTDNIMGMRIRLKANFDVSGYSTTNQIILNAMKKYGMILADNGGDLFFEGTPDPRWDDVDLSNLKSIPNTAFEVVQMGPVYDQYSAPTGPAPQINSFTASVSSVVSGSPVVLTPNVTNGSYEFIDNAGFARGPVTVYPTQTTTYTLWTRNDFQTSTSSVTVNVSATSTALSFTSLKNQVYGNAPFTVSATSNSPGAITYAVLSGPATISGNVVTLTGVGTVALQATQAASGSYAAATATGSFSVSSATPVINFNPIPDQNYSAGSIQVTAVSNSPGSITYAVVSGPATISGNTVSFTGLGTVTLQASQPAAGGFQAASTTTLFTIVGSAPTLTFTAIPDKVYGAAPFTVSATSNSTGPITYSVVSGPATLSGNTVTLTGVGTVTLQAKQAPAGAFTAGSTVTSFNVTAAAPTLSFNSIATQSYGAAPFAVSATSNSTGVITYSVANGPASISGNLVSLTGAGTVTLQASQAAAGTYAAGTATTTFQVNAVSPTLTFNPVASQTYGTAPFAVSASSNSTGAITYSVLSGPATISGATVTLTGVGTVSLQASQAAAGGYSATTATTAFTVSSQTTTLSFATIASQTYGAAPFAVLATSSSTGAITYSVASGPATISGTIVTLTGVGTVTLQASQAAAAGYSAATATTAFNVAAHTPTLTFNSIANQTFGASPFTVSATSNSTGAITYSVASGPASLAGNIVSLTGTGTVTLQASQVAAGTFAAGTATVTFNVTGAGTSLVFSPIATQTFGAAPFAVSATSNSTAAITYSVVSGPATLSGNIVSLTGSGSVTLQASQAATGSYSAASTNTSFTVNAASTTLTFSPIATQTFGAAPFAVSAISNSTAAITYSVLSGPANLSGNIVTLTGSGNVTLQASQAATGSYSAASTNTSFTVNAASTTLAFSPIATQTFGAAPFAVSATSASTGAITYSVLSGPATISGNIVTLTGSGSVTLQASQAARGSYAAASANTTFTVNAATTTLAFSPITNQTFGAAPFPVSATSNSTAAITYSVLSGPATLTGNIVTLTGSGNVTLQASQAASAGYTAATTNTSFSVGGSTPSLSITPIANQSFSMLRLTLSAASNSFGAIHWSVLSGPATVSGNILTFTDTGSITVQATQAASGAYTAATASTSFNVHPGTSTLSFDTIPTQVFGSGPITVTAVSNSTGPITYSVLNGPAVITGNSVAFTGVGTVTLRAAQAAYAGFAPASVTTRFDVVAPAANLSIKPIPTQTYGSGPITVSATSASSAPITFAVLAGPASITGTSLSLSGAGSVTVQATQPASANYQAAIATTTFTISPSSVVLPADFALPRNTTLTIKQGATGTATIPVSAVNGFSGIVSFSCSVPASMTPGTCDPKTASLTSSTAASSTITVGTRGTQTAQNRSLSPRDAAAGAAFLAMMLPCGLPLFSRRKLNLRSFTLGLLLALTLAGTTLTTTGCGSMILNGVTPPGTYVLPVQASAGNAAHSMTLTVVVESGN